MSVFIRYRGFLSTLLVLLGGVVLASGIVGTRGQPALAKSPVTKKKAEVAKKAEISKTETKTAVKSRPATEKDIKKVEKYFRNLKTARARFVQTTNDGGQAVGTFYLKRPGRLRFDYDPPLKDFIVADGRFIYFYDGELEEQTNAPIGSTLANFFLRKDFKLSGDLTIKRARHAGGYLQIEVVQTKEPEAGSLIFAFTEKPFELKKWRVIDPQGSITEVELFYLKTGIDLDKKLFVYIDPKFKDKSRKPKYNN